MAQEEVHNANEHSAVDQCQQYGVYLGESALHHHKQCHGNTEENGVSQQGEDSLGDSSFRGGKEDGILPHQGQDKANEELHGCVGYHKFRIEQQGGLNDDPNTPQAIPYPVIATTPL